MRKRTHPDALHVLYTLFALGGFVLGLVIGKAV